VQFVPERLMGLTEIAEMLGVSRQRVYQLVRTAGFPEPLARLAQGAVWAGEDVERWAREDGRLD
jgi:predicted DNA-binding transcriptional regulator AlpA